MSCATTSALNRSTLLPVKFIYNFLHYTAVDVDFRFAVKYILLQNHTKCRHDFMNSQRALFANWKTHIGILKNEFLENNITFHTSHEQYSIQTSYRLTFYAYVDIDAYFDISTNRLFIITVHDSLIQFLAFKNQKDELLVSKVAVVVQSWCPFH